MVKSKYTDAQLRSMTEAPWTFSEQLRTEAKRRGFAARGSSSR